MVSRRTTSPDTSPVGTRFSVHLTAASVLSRALRVNQPEVSFRYDRSTVKECAEGGRVGSGACEDTVSSGLAISAVRSDCAEADQGMRAVEGHTAARCQLVR